MRVTRLEVDFYGLGKKHRRQLDSHLWRQDSRRILNEVGAGMVVAWGAIDVIQDCSYSMMMLDWDPMAERR